MPTVQVKAQLSTEDMLQAVKQLKTSELEGFFWQVIALLARRKAPGLSRQESDLMMKINRGIPLEKQEYYNKLIAKRRSETLTDEEYEALLKLTDQIEKLDVERLGYLKELASIQGISLTSIMKKLHIKKPSYGRTFSS
ncbi:MAG: STAS/SEC14 domain-containing protein [Candidatus Omnitrophota bacterium]